MIPFRYLFSIVIPDSIRDPEHLKLERACPAGGGIASLVRNDDLLAI